MFGGLEASRNSVPRLRASIPNLIDVPSSKADDFGHIMSCNQRKEEHLIKTQGSFNQLLREDNTNTKQIQAYFRNLNTRVDEKMKEYEESIEERRQKLKELMWYEEREQIREVVDVAQRGKADDLLEMKIRTQQLRAKRESERQEIVREKRLQQYLEKCEEFRPVVAKRRLAETKQAQLVQIQENESRKESQREEEHMWYQLLIKEMEAQADREQQDNLCLQKRNFEDKSVWDMQCKARELQRADKIREIREDAIKLNNLKEELIREEIAALDAKRRKRDQLYRETMTQIKEREECLARKAEEEALFNKSYEKLQLEEIEKEKSLNQKEKLKFEMLQYRDYIARLDQERREEEKRLNELVQQELNQIQAKQDEAKCRIEQAREALKKDVLIGRNEQLAYKRQEAEEQLKMKQAENQLFQMAHDQNERMRAEFSRRQVLAAKQYETDLRQQMEYAKILKDRERDEIEKRLQQGRAEEEEYKNILTRVLNSDVKISEVHPFRKVLNREQCPCPKNLYY